MAKLMKPKKIPNSARGAEEHRLRDLFAAHALTGLLAAETIEHPFDDYAEVAENAYMVAEEMLKAR